MPNNYSTLVNERSSLKFFLIRIKPARDISSDLVLFSGTTYQMTLNVPTVPNLEVNGVAYTKVSSLTPSSSQFYFNDDTKLLRVNFGAALTSQIVVAYYYLFMTNDIYKRAMENPFDLTGSFYDYDPRIASDPDFEISQQNVMFGTISISSTSLELKNQDNYFQQYLTDNDSFYNKEIIFWHCLNDVNNNVLTYKGFVTNYSLSKDNLILEIDSDFKALLKTKFSTDTFDNSFFTLASFPKLDPSLDFTPVTRYYCRVSPHEINSDVNSPANSMAVRVAGDAALIAGASWLKLRGERCVAVNVSRGNDPTGGGVNRTWIAGATPVTLLSVLNFTITSVAAYFPATELGWNLYVVGISAADRLNLTIGDSFFLTGNVNNCAHILGEVPGGVLIATAPTNPAPLVNNVYIRQVISQVQIECLDIQKNGENLILPLIPNIDYNQTITNDHIIISLSPNFEAKFPELTAVKPHIEEDYVMRFVCHVDTPPSLGVNYDIDLNHASVLKGLIEEAGLSTNATSFTNAGATNILLNFTIPFQGSTEFPTYLEVIEKILESTGGYITINSSNEIEYYLLDAPNSPTAINDDSILKDSLTQKFSFDDIASSITFKNIHGGIYIWKDNNTSTRAGSNLYKSWSYQNTINNEQENNPRATYLHGITKNIQIENFLDGTTTSNAFDRIKRLRFNRIAKFGIAIKNFANSKLGDNFQIQSQDLAGTNTRDIRIFTKRQSKNYTNIEGYDLIDL